MIKTACILGFLIVLIVAPLALADVVPGESLDSVIARVTKPVPVSAKDTDTTEKSRAVEILREWPRTDDATEEKIVAALNQARTVPEPGLRDNVAMALGQRNRRELIPEYFARIDTEPQTLRSFFSLLPDRELNPPLDHLRRSFESRNPEARVIALELAEWCKAVALRSEIERLLIGDPTVNVRNRAAQTLSFLDCRESVPALRSALRGGDFASETMIQALARLGSDAEVELLAPKLQSKSAERRRLVAEAMAEMRLTDPRPAIEAMLPLLDDASPKVRLAAIKALGNWKAPQVVPAIRALLRSKTPPYGENRQMIIQALGAIGNDESIEILNAMPFSESGVREQLLQLAHPSTAYAAWDAYLCDPIRANPDSDVFLQGDNDALQIVEKLADADLFRAIRLRAQKADDKGWEKAALNEVIEALAKRFPEVAAEPIASLTSNAPSTPSDRDKDGVPDRLDKYPDDHRRSQDIPVAHFSSSIPIPMANYAYIPLASEGPAAKAPLFMAIDDEGRIGWITQVNDAEPPDYHVASGYPSEKDEWSLPNPGDNPCVYRLIPSSINSSGTVVGTALRKKVALPLRQNLGEAHLTFQSGFVFEKGKLRFDPPAPFTGNAPNVSYRRINNRGLIFGHREERVRDGDKDVYRTFAFLGDRTFRDVPLFDAIAMTDAGQLLCFRVTNDKQESFVWDGDRFHDLGSLSGKPEAVRAYAMNQKLQVVGLSDALDESRCPIGFFWENGRMRPFSELIPEQFRAQLRSAIPYLISDSGTITFRAEEKSGPFPQFWPKRNFTLELGEDGQNHVSVQVITNQNRDE